MKQHIDNEQLQTLAKREKKILYAWCEKKQYLEPLGGGLMQPLLSIGQMIEFIREHERYTTISSLAYWEIVKHYPDLLVDKLWEETVKILKKYDE